MEINEREPHIYPWKKKKEVISLKYITREHMAHEI